MIAVLAPPGEHEHSLFQMQLDRARQAGVILVEWSTGSLLTLGLTKPYVIDALTGLGFKPPVRKHVE